MAVFIETLDTELHTLKAFKANSSLKTLNFINCKNSQINFLKDPVLKQKIETFEEKLKKKICYDIPTAFCHRKKHIVKLPYIKDFDEKNIPTKARPIQMSQEVMEFCKKEITELLSKGINQKSKSPWSCTAFYVQKSAELEKGAP